MTLNNSVSVYFTDAKYRQVKKPCTLQSKKKRVSTKRKHISGHLTEISPPSSTGIMQSWKRAGLLDEKLSGMY